MNQSPDFSRYDQKLELILRTSARIFADKSFHSTSMREISRETGVSLAGLYHYCKSKEELLFLMMNWIYNWYDPRGKLSVNQLVDNITRLFVNGFLVPGNAQFALEDSPASEKVNIWRSA